ncbi:Gfo/Idh/MocA family oxidoreductase [Phyllobacterium sp. OV277]|uniref:Gfo/Idh/MocA family protein n=1 Tax=Phyllobacterium sp. OV277 TaxID=1882772 RepID=UPI0008820B58|nr:Gfo/Idh/MocA family oxidoreductase [Phyllobacterium sp. OV277]SDP90821.1 Predicted dehydrogenase [Phyllobacterium sp. OV277]
MANPIRVAIIGAGIGASHLKGYRALPNRFTVSVLCDLDQERAAKVTDGDRSIRIEPDLDRVLADPDIDIIDICLPPHLHFKVSMAALAAGKHVVCEKPFVSSLHEADLLAEAVQKSGRILSPVFQYRFGRGFAQLRALIDKGLAGKAYTSSIETHWCRRAEYYDIPWRGTWKGEQGGAVLSHAIHNHDLLCYVMGNVRRLTAFTATRVNPIETEDCASIVFEMESGALATSSITLGAADDTSHFRFCFEGFTAESGKAPYTPAEDTWHFLARDPARQAEIDAVVNAVPEVHSGFAGFFDALADAIEGQGGNEVTVADGRRSLEMVTAIYHTARTGGTAELPLNHEHPLYKGWTPK